MAIYHENWEESGGKLIAEISADVKEPSVQFNFSDGRLQMPEGFMMRGQSASHAFPASPDSGEFYELPCGMSTFQFLDWLTSFSGRLLTVEDAFDLYTQCNGAST